MFVPPRIHCHNHLLITRGPGDKTNTIRKIRELPLLLCFYIQYPSLINPTHVSNKGKLGSVRRPERSVSTMNKKVLKHVNWLGGHIFLSLMDNNAIVHDFVYLCRSQRLLI